MTNMIQKPLMLLIAFSVLFCSCNRRILTFKFPQDTPDIVPDDAGFYGDVKSVFVKSTDQVVLSANDLSSKSSILVNMIERQFQKNGFTIVPNAKDADLTIELVALESAGYHTNTAFKKNGKEVKYKCNFSFWGHRIFIKAINKQNRIVNYTFYQTPCVTGCQYRIGRECDLYKPRAKKKNKKEIDQYIITAKEFPLNVELNGAIIAEHIIQQIKHK